MAQVTVITASTIIPIQTSYYISLMCLTTPEGFLIGSIGFKTSVTLNVGLYASSNTLKYSSFNFSTIAPKALTQSEWFGRKMLKIQPKFQNPLGSYSKQVIPEDTYIRVGLVVPQSGLSFGTWMQIYTPNPVKYRK